MTNAELVALLREARKVALDAMRPASHISYTQWTPEMHRASIVLRDIDAALAEHADSATPVVESEVKWHSINSPQWFEAKENGALLTVKYVAKAEWHWTVEQRVGGHKRSVEEAKSAAISAARGLK